MTAVRHPYRLTEARQLATGDAATHIADLVRLVLLTGMNERLHHPEFGAGLGTSVLFEPLDGAIASVVEARARGSLERALGDRIELLELAVENTDATTLEANVRYRLLGAGDTRTVTVTLDG